MSEDYRKILAETEDFLNWMEEIEEEAKLTSWKCLYRDDQFAVYINYEGEIRTIGMPYVERIFKNDNIQNNT